MRKEFLGCQIEKREKEEFQKLAAADFRTVADYLRLVIRNHLANPLPPETDYTKSRGSPCYGRNVPAKS